jgi:hypothetical protein
VVVGLVFMGLGLVALVVAAMVAARMLPAALQILVAAAGPISMVVVRLVQTAALAL